MSVMDDCITLSDDDAVVEVQPESASVRTEKTNCTDAVETIVIDEDVGPTSTDSDNIIVLSDSQNSADDTFTQSLNVIRKEDTVFAYLIDLCLQLENSDGMIRIIQRTVMKSYAECDNEYITSKNFTRLALKTISQIEKDPDHKFSHIKNFVQILRTHKFKKKVDFITLATNLKGKLTPGLTSKSQTKKSQSINNNNSIILDSDEDIPAVDVDEITNGIICLDDESEKENHRTENSCNSDENISADLQSSQGSLTLVEPKELPIEYEPQTTVTVSESSRSELSPEVLARIKSIELQIAGLKRQITALEEMEVDDDSIASPYVICESYKASVVKLYKELCTLIGKQPVKKRKVRLKVLEGHPSGPVKRLELFINNNIGEDGLPLFPDFCDVVKCVMVASIEDNLGWNKQQIMREANSLFIQCGRALQKKRQKREYRDLLALVKQEDHDPADDDPELQRRLEINRRAGVKKEMDLLERFSQIQDLPQRPKSGSILEEIFTNNHEPSCSNQVLDDGKSSISNVSSTRIDDLNRSMAPSKEKQIGTNEQNIAINIPKPISNCVLVIDPADSEPYIPINVSANNENGTDFNNEELSSDRVFDNKHSDSELISRETTIDLGNSRIVHVTHKSNVNHDEIEENKLDHDKTDQVQNINSLNNNNVIGNDNDEILNSDDKNTKESLINVDINADQEANPCLGIILSESVQSICCNEIISDDDSNLELPNIALPDQQTKETNVISEQAERSDSPYSDIVISDEDSNFEPPEIPLAIKDETMEPESNVSETENNETVVKAEVKTEPMDIVKMLEELGNDYTTSVIDIEDPFLVIEISSDSSEDEMELDYEDL